MNSLSLESCLTEVDELTIEVEFEIICRRTLNVKSCIVMIFGIINIVLLPLVRSGDVRNRTRLHMKLNPESIEADFEMS